MTSTERIEDYRVRLRSLIWAAQLLRDLSHTKDEGAVLVAVNWALDAVYDLSEAYWILTGPKKPSLALQDDHLASLTPTAGEKVGGLLAEAAEDRGESDAGRGPDAVGDTAGPAPARGRPTEDGMGRSNSIALAEGLFLL